MNLTHFLVCLSCSTALLPADETSAPPQPDAVAIRSMAGTFAVDFRFHETYSLSPDYKVRTKAYEEHATELVKVVEDTPTRITLQHLLVVNDGDKPQVIKHWSQVWTWGDSFVLDYCGQEDDHRWNIVQADAASMSGTWTQLVTNVDDSPRYESRGFWIHENGISTWTSQATRRPLPRREYSKRDDYDYLLVTNRHVITPTGWVHYQDNHKVVDRGDERKVLCHEAGLNQYTRVESPATAIAESWWQEKGNFWNAMRNVWLLEMNKPGKSFAYHTVVDGYSLSEKFREWEKQPESTDAAAHDLMSFLSRQP